MSRVAPDISITLRMASIRCDLDGPKKPGVGKYSPAKLRSICVRRLTHREVSPLHSISTILKVQYVPASLMKVGLAPG